MESEEHWMGIKNRVKAGLYVAANRRGMLTTVACANTAAATAAERCSPASMTVHLHRDISRRLVDWSRKERTLWGWVTPNPHWSMQASICSFPACSSHLLFFSVPSIRFEAEPKWHIHHSRTLRVLYMIEFAVSSRSICCLSESDPADRPI